MVCIAFDIFLEPQFYGWGEPQYIWGVYNQYSHKHGARRGVVSTAYPECEDVARFDGWVRLCQPAHHWWSPGYNTRHTSFLMEAKYENNMSCFKWEGIRYGWYQGYIANNMFPLWFKMQNGTRLVSDDQLLVISFVTKIQHIDLPWYWLGNYVGAI